MKDDTKAKFEQAIDGYVAASVHAKEEQDQKLSARQRFEQQWRENRDAVVMPALTQIAELLHTKGWQCQITSVDADLGVTIDVYKGLMRGVVGSGRPHITFKADPHSEKISVRSTTQSGSGAVGTGGFGMPLTEEVVQQQVLQFFQRLASEGPPRQY
jgi:hypothetical protein